VFDRLGFGRKKILQHLDKVCHETKELPLMDRAKAMYPCIDRYLGGPDEGRRLRRGDKLIGLAGSDRRLGKPLGQQVVRHASATLRAASERYEVAHKLTRRIAARLDPVPGQFLEPTRRGAPWQATAVPNIDAWAARLAMQHELPELERIDAAWQQVLPPLPPGPPRPARGPSQAAARSLNDVESQRYQDIIAAVTASLGHDAAACLSLPQLDLPQAGPQQGVPADVLQMQQHVLWLFAGANLAPLQALP
jgi:hypothetical protein